MHLALPGRVEQDCGDGLLEPGVGIREPAALRLLRHRTRSSLSIDIVVQVGGDMFGTMRSTIAGGEGHDRVAGLRDRHRAPVVEASGCGRGARR
jgi:hypothetical protein